MQPWAELRTVNKSSTRHFWFIRVGRCSSNLSYRWILDRLIRGSSICNYCKRIYVSICSPLLSSGLRSGWLKCICLRQKCMWRQLPTGNTLYLQRNQSLGAHLNKASARQWTFLMFGCLQEGKFLCNLPFTIQGNSFFWGAGPDKRKKKHKSRQVSFIRWSQLSDKFDCLELWFRL